MSRSTAVLVAGWLLAAAAGLGWWQTWSLKACPPEASVQLPAKVVARVDGREIPGEDLEMEALAAQAQRGIRYEGPEGERQLQELRARLLDGLVDRALLEEHARRRKLQPDPAKLQEAEARLRSQIPPGTTLARLVERGAFREALRRRAESAFLLEALFEQLRREWAVRPEEVEAYYRERRAEFREPEAAFFRQIVVEDRETAEEAVRRVRAGEPFEAVGERLAPGKGPFDRGALELRMLRGNPDPREPVLFRMRPGELAGPIPIPVGYVVLRLERKVPAREISLSEARARIQSQLAAQKYRAGLARLLRDLRSKATIERLLAPSSPTPSPTPSPSPSPTP